jgi:hypothetical protein
VCAVGAAALLHGLVDLDVADEQRVNVQALHLLCLTNEQQQQQCDKQREGQLWMWVMNSASTSRPFTWGG